MILSMKRRRSHIWTSRIGGAVALAAAFFGLTCASASTPTVPSTTSAPAPESADRRARNREAARLYSEAEDEFQAADYVAAESLANNIVIGYRDTDWLAPGLLLSSGAALELNQPEKARAVAGSYLRLYRASDPERVPGLVLVARSLYLEGRPVEAADSLLAAPEGLGDERDAAAQMARQVAQALGLGEIEAVMARWPANHTTLAVFEVERASLLLAAGQADSARKVAGEALALDPLDPERDRARAIESGELETEQWRPIIGAILPLSGPLAAYGRLAEEGIRLAIDEYNERHYDQVTLIVRDDADRYERDGDLVRELERLGAVAIIGPLRAEGLEEAARRRRDRDLVIVSPTADENYSYERNVFSVWSTTERVTRGARSLAAFAVSDLQIDRFGVMYPNTREGRTQLASFADAVRARGGEIVASITYDDTATTFQDPLTFLGTARPQAIYAPASSPRSVIQMAPQFSYYGLRGVQVLGDADWSEPEVLRLVEPRFIDGTVISTFLYRSSPSVRWPDFVEMYERTYRKGLRGSMVPALAYDATRMVLAALPWGYPRRSAIARSFREIRSLPGATGVFSVEHGAITRRPFLLQFKERDLVPAFDELRDSLSVGDGGANR
jgi:branched-chain amino acid transport system substrate-binding protein